MGPEDWEGIARDLLDATCTTAPVNAFDLAAAADFVIEYGPCAGDRCSGGKVDLERRVILVDSRANAERAQSLVAHELGHFALDRVGVMQSEAAAKHIGGALRMPWAEMNRDVRDTAWSLVELHARHPHASHLALAVRITQLRTAALALFDPHGRTPAWRIANERVGRDIARAPTTLEYDLAIEAWNEQREIRHGELVVATPLPNFSAGEHRVLVIGHVDELRGASRTRRAA